MHEPKGDLTWLTHIYKTVMPEQPEPRVSAPFDIDVPLVVSHFFNTSGYIQEGATMRRVEGTEAFAWHSLDSASR